MQCKRDSPVDKHKEVSPRKEAHADTSGRVDVMMLEGRLQEEMGERRRLELELEKLQRGTVTLEEQGERERGRRLSVLPPEAVRCSLGLVDEDRLSNNQVFLRNDFALLFIFHNMQNLPGNILSLSIKKRSVHPSILRVLIRLLPHGHQPQPSAAPHAVHCHVGALGLATSKNVESL